MFTTLCLVILLPLFSLGALYYKLLGTSDMLWNLYRFNVATAEKWRANVFSFIREDEAKRQARPWKDKVDEMLILPDHRPLAEARSIFLGQSFKRAVLPSSAYGVVLG